VADVRGQDKPALQADLDETTLHNFPHAFVNRRAEPILVKTLGEKRHRQLVEMYLAFRPRNCFSGLPPLTDPACVRWVEGVIAAGINLVALSFEEGLVGHAALFPIDAQSCEMLCAVSPPDQKIGIGTELTRCAIQLAHELGFDEIRLNVEAGNHVARHVYEKCGFHYLTRGLLGELDMSLDLQRHRDATNVPVREIMNTHVMALYQEMPCRTALEMFLEGRVATLPVINEKGELVGILSETDLLDAANMHKRVAEVLTREVVSVPVGCTIAKLISLFRSRKLRCIPVVDRRNELIGVVGRRDILDYYLRRL